MTLETGAPTFLEGMHSATHDVNSPTAFALTIYSCKTAHQRFALILSTSLGFSLLVLTMTKFPSCQEYDIVLSLLISSEEILLPASRKCMKCHTRLLSCILFTCLLCLHYVVISFLEFSSTGLVRKFYVTFDREKSPDSRIQSPFLVSIDSVVPEKNVRIQNLRLQREP